MIEVVLPNGVEVETEVQGHTVLRMTRGAAEALFEELFVALVPPLSTEGDRE